MASGKLKKRLKAKRSILALTSSAMALPNMPNTADAATAPEPSLSIQLSSYEESDLSAADRSSDGTGSLSRYSIPVFMATATMPYRENLAFTFDLAFERMSGASPWYVTPAIDPDTSNFLVDTDGRPIPKVRMTGATIEDTRTDLGVTTHYYLPRAQIDGNLRVSSEDDYHAVSGALGVAVETEDKMGTWSSSISVSSDSIEATDSHIYTRRPDGKRRKGTFSVYTGYTQVLNKFSTFEMGLGVKMHSGYLTDPYREVVFFDGASISNSHESRPEDRILTTWIGRYRRYSENWKGTFHLDYRLYDDNWGITSHTFDTAWYRDIGPTMQIVPNFRLYMQSGADFYEPIFEGVQADFNYYSSDYRLSPYGAMSFGLKFIKRFEVTTVSFDIENYNSSDSLGLGDGEASPAIVDFYTLSLGIATKF